MRAITTSFRNGLQASSSEELVLVFVTVTHTDLVTPVLIVSEDENGVSWQNGEIVNYRYGGNLFQGCPFAIELLTDDDRPPRGRIVFADPERRFGIELLPLVDSPRLKIELLRSSDFDTNYDADNARNPIGSPMPEYVASHLFMRNVSGDAMMLTAELMSYDMVGEPWPKIRSTIDRLPGIFR